jgi:predicted signal transduction protein with EAL and GGDEF domain
MLPPLQIRPPRATIRQGYLPFIREMPAQSPAAGWHVKTAADSAGRKSGYGRSLPALGFAALCLTIGLLGFLFMQWSTQTLLAADAREEAESWAGHLLRSLPNLPAVARGTAPSGANLELLRLSAGAARIYEFRVYDRNGLLKLRSDDFYGRLSIDQPVEKIDREFAGAIRSGRPATHIHQGSVIGEPEYFAAIALPIREGGATAGWLVVFVDQSSRQALFFRMAMQVTIAVGSLLVVAPLLGFWYRARQRHDFQRKLEDISQRDPLTGLANRASFVKRIGELLDPSGERRSALIVCEVSDLDVVGQSYGQEAAENAALLASLRLSQGKPDPCELGCLDRGRFGLFLPDAPDAMAVLSLAKDLTARLAEPVAWGGASHVPKAHAGIGLSASDGKDGPALLRSAELALRSAQEQGAPGYGFFNPEIAQDARRRMAVQKAVADAAAAQAFRLDFQPYYSIRTGELVGFEALIRLHDAELGSISPAEFIPIAERTGLIARIGAWCLEEACRVAALWPPHLTVAVNLSPSQFYAGSLIGDIRHALDLSRVPPYRLEVEITEGTMLKDSELVLQQLRVLRDMGVAVALDDFGTGYSSLSYLWKFPFSKLKIDRSFVSALDETPSARGILRSIVRLGRGLGMTVTAEGIETVHQLTALRELGCDLAQGYLLDRPARIDDLAAIILRNFAKGLKGRDTAAPSAAARPAAPASSAA